MRAQHECRHAERKGSIGQGLIIGPLCTQYLVMGWEEELRAWWLLRGDLGWSTGVLAVNRVSGLQEAKTGGGYTVVSGLAEYSWREIWQERSPLFKPSFDLAGGRWSSASFCVRPRGFVDPSWPVLPGARQDTSFRGEERGLFSPRYPPITELHLATGLPGSAPHWDSGGAQGQLC